MDPFVGEIRMFTGNFAPRDWAPCDGRVLVISQNPELFAVLGTTYGGDGRTTFALPDLRGSVPIGAGHGPGLTERAPGQSGGQASVTLAADQLPVHTHAAQASGGVGSEVAPAGNVWAAAGGERGEKLYGTDAGAAMSPQALGDAGGGAPHNNLQPYVAVTFIICVSGIFPQHP